MIIGINLDSIEAKKIENLSGNIRIDNNTSIKNVSQVKVPVTTEKVSKIDFEFRTQYTHSKKVVGYITFTGSVLYKGNIENIHTSWKDERKLPDDVAMVVMNNILRKCISRAIDISEQIMLPPPINLPSVKPKKTQNIEYIG